MLTLNYVLSSDLNRERSALYLMHWQNGQSGLAVAFAEYRKWPDNPMIQHKCFLYAGFLAHYAQDMCQPLHLTINFDGLGNPTGHVYIRVSMRRLIQQLNAWHSSQWTSRGDNGLKLPAI